MTSKNAEDPSWNIEIIPPNETGFAFYLSEYKPFRLTALREDPDGKAPPTYIYLIPKDTSKSQDLVFTYVPGIT